MTRQTLEQREWEDISAYLDGQLSEKDRSQFEAKLSQREDLRLGLEEIRRTRAVLRQQKVLRAPRNFTLTPNMVEARSPAGFSYKMAANLVTVLRTSAALASFLFVLVVITNVFLVRPASQSLRSAEKAAPEVLATEVVAQAPAAEVAPTETSGEEMAMPYPDMPPEMEMPGYSQPFPPYGGAEAGGVGGGSPSATGEPPFEAAPPMFVEPPPTTEPSVTMKEAPVAQDNMAGEYPAPATGNAVLETPTPYPQPVTQATSSKEGMGLNLNLVAGLLAFLAIVSGVAAFLINRSLKAS